MSRILSLVLAVVALVAAVAADHGPAMRNEDVVRMLVAGHSTAEVLEAIRTRPPGFELSDEMLTELRLAGVSDAVIAAMRERQRESDSAATPSPASPSPSPVVRVVLRATRGPEAPDGRRAILFPSAPEPPVRARFGLGDGGVTDLALFLACTTATHVPDHWRAASPLGRDFVSAPRHGILTFRPGAPRGEDGLLRLPVPDALESESPEAGPHDLLVGVAAEVDGRWIALASVAIAEPAASAGDAALAVEVRSGSEKDGFVPRLEAVSP